MCLLSQPVGGVGVFILILCKRKRLKNFMNHLTFCSKCDIIKIEKQVAIFLCAEPLDFLFRGGESDE